MRLWIGLTFACAAASMLVGCASGGAQINSRALETGTTSLSRVVMFYNAKSPHFTGNLYTTFVAATQRLVESCGVVVTTLEFDSLEFDMREKLAEVLETNNPDAVLFFVRDGGNLVTDMGGGGTSGNLYFNVEAIDPRASTTMWKARIDYRTLTGNMFVNDKSSGEKFASQFVSRLASDRLFSGCPAEVVTPK